MRTELYVREEGAIHRLHPVVKLGLFVAAIAGTFLGLHPRFVAIVVAAQLGAAALAGGRAVLAALVRPWRLLLFIFAFTVALWTLLGGADYPAMTDRLLAASGYAVRVMAIVLGGMLFLGTTSIEETVAAFRSVGVPYVVAFTFGLAFRLVPLFLGSAASIVEAQRARGLDVERGGVRARLRAYVPVLVPIFMTSLRQADQMAMALESRGFGASAPRRTSFRRYRLGPGDAIAAAVAAGIIGLLIWLRRIGFGEITP